MNRRRLLIGGVALGLAVPSTARAQENLKEYRRQLSLPDGAVSKAMRRFKDDDLEVGYFVTIFQDSAAAKAWFGLERGNTVAFSNQARGPGWSKSV